MKDLTDETPLQFVEGKRSLQFHTSLVDNETFLRVKNEEAVARKRIVQSGGGGGGGTPRNFRPKYSIFHTRFQTWSLKYIPIFRPSLYRN